MKAIWKRIHEWLDENAPEGYGNLCAGASAEAIRAAETEMKRKLPRDVKASYRIHDGQSSEPGLIGGEGWCLLTLKEMVGVWRRWSEADPCFANRVPVASGGTGDYIFIDLSPDAETLGCLIVQRGDSDQPDSIAPSFASWLEDFADQLDDGEFAYSMADGQIMYADECDLD